MPESDSMSLKFTVVSLSGHGLHAAFPGELVQVRTGRPPECVVAAAAEHSPSRSGGNAGSSDRLHQRLSSGQSLNRGRQWRVRAVV